MTKRPAFYDEWVRLRWSWAGWCTFIRERRCALTGGHRWTGFFESERPVTGDFRAFFCSTRCARCHTVLSKCTAVSFKMFEYANEPEQELIDYAYQRMRRELLVHAAVQSPFRFERLADFLAGQPRNY